MGVMQVHWAVEKSIATIWFASWLDAISRKCSRGLVIKSPAKMEIGLRSNDYVPRDIQIMRFRSTSDAGRCLASRDWLAQVAQKWPRQFSESTRRLKAK